MAAKRFGGRPRREPEPGERVHLGLRVTPEMKRRLEEAAAAKGRSQSQEVELRLERSFDREDLLIDVLSLAYGRQFGAVLLLLGNAMKTAGEGAYFSKPREGIRDWPEDPQAYDRAVNAANCLLECLRGEIKWPSLQPDPEQGEVQTAVRKTLSDDRGLAVLDLLGPVFAGRIDEFLSLAKVLQEPEK